jgi:hypothetical protein
MARLKNLLDYRISLGNVAATTDSAAIILDGIQNFSAQNVITVLSFSAAVMASASNVFAKTDPTHPSQFQKTNHGFVTGLKVQIATSSALPTPLLVLTDYYVIKIDSDYFQLAASASDALAGSEIELDNVGTGNQTVTAVALASASIKLEKSNDGTNWNDEGSATNITVSATVFLEKVDPSAKYMRIRAAITSGAMAISSTIIGKGLD